MGERGATVGVMDRFEKGIERAVNGAFAKAFRSEVQPVEIASALRREVDDKAAVVARDRTIVPNAFVVELGHADHERLGEWSDALGDELGAVINDHARQQRYSFVGPVRVEFEEAGDLDTGVFRVRSQTARRDDPAGLVQPPPAPAGPIRARPDQADVRPIEATPIEATQIEATQIDQLAGARRRGQPMLEVDGRPYQITTDVTVIGRGADADIVIDDPGASRRHAEVHLFDGKARVIDLGSTNGTFVDGDRVPVSSLREGSTITIGRTRITYHGAESAVWQPPGADHQRRDPQVPGSW